MILTYKMHSNKETSILQAFLTHNLNYQTFQHDETIIMREMKFISYVFVKHCGLDQ